MAVFGWVVFLIFTCKQSHAFEVEVHERISEEAIDDVEGEISRYLIDNIGLSGGLLEIVGKEGENLEDIIKKGSMQEDEPLKETRYLNHFYNPMDGSGLYDNKATTRGMSSYEWARYNRNDRSWREARGKFLEGLTLEAKAQRDEVSAWSTIGIAPMEVSFNIDTNTGTAVSKYLIDFDGDVTTDLRKIGTATIFYVAQDNIQVKKGRSQCMDGRHDEACQRYSQGLHRIWRYKEYLSRQGRLILLHFTYAFFKR